MNAFGRGAGPATTTSGTGKPSSNTGRFGVNHPRPPSPPPPPFTYPSPAPPWGPEAVEGVQSPPFAYESSGLAANAYLSNGIVRKPAVPGGVQSPPLAFWSSHPAAKITYPYVGAHRPIESPYIWVNGQRPINKDDGQANSRPGEVMPFVATHSAGASLTSKITRFQDLKAAKFPVSHAMDAQISRDSGQTSLQRPALSPALFGQPKLPGPHSTMSVHQDRTPVLYSDLYDSGSSFNEADAHAAKRTRSPVLPVHEVFQEDAHNVQRESKRPSISPSRLGTGLASISSSFEALIAQRSVQSVDDAADEAGSTRSSSFPVAKRTRSPPVSADEALPGNFNFIQDDTERELQAKARRLERFKKELHEDGPNSVGQSFPVSRYEQPKVEKQKHSGDIRMESGGDFCNGNNASDYEGSETPSMITGLCPDMCPESERAERERKGDLDQYERVDGDRNQTNRFLAVKKYNRTAEREAILIRPMPVLQKTVEYLLNLLDHPYDDKLLGIYNFLWDRMRAIRMDLRMQHIFNQEAITMLERMIRLHVIAMHELCEYTKGEGFSEGFDAHLNIEQMNKTSVELFQMYDDHRKKGINVPTEKEFRGYYALLKLDKHPGYKVEPAELSLDLAKMTPEIRQTPEVLFARNVARACRTGNFIAFFRLARKASYLQACLMHAHFAKLRTQALAALHSGLQINQGLPIMHVAKWLAMEGEDVESLLDYHGFLIKDYEEPYVVKEGQFLNDDKDYPTSCSKLVYLKRSRRIVEDVSPNVQVVPLSVEATTEIQLPKLYKHHDKKNVPSALGIWKNPPAVVEEEMPDAEVVPSPKVDLLRQPLMKQPAVAQQSPDCYRVAGKSISPWGISVAHSSSESQPAKPGGLEKPNNDAFFTVFPERKILSGLEVVPSPITPKTASHGMSSGSKRIEVSPFPTMTKTSFDGIGRMSPKAIHSFSVEKSVPEEEVVQDLEVEEPCHFIDDNACSDAVEENEDEEVFLAKIKLIIRLWRRRSAKLKELREQRQIAAEAALGTLFLGPQIRHMKNIRQPSMACKFDIDRIMRERYMKHQKLWSTLNISDVVGNTLSRRNPHAEFLYWKIILCSQIYSQAGEEELQRHQIKNMAAGPWLKSKLMPSKAEDDDNDELLVSSPALSIWKKWLPSQSGKDSACCFSFVKDVKLGVTYETVAGAGGVLFVVSESIPWNLQRIQLHDLVMSIPSGASLPLLVLSSCDGECLDPSSIVVNELGLCDIDKSRVSSFLVVSLTGDELMEGVNGFFSDKQLREGLQWLARESPQQPDLFHIKARELVLSHLNPSLSVLESRAGLELGPDHCISAFNEALDLSVREIIAAADANHARWPFPEILLLEYSCREWKILTRELPSLGWSSSEIIEPLLCAVRACKLPSFTNGRSWLEEGTNNHHGIEDLKLQLESQLIEYLSQSAAMMGIQFAAKEAHVMVQRSTQLVLHGSTYFIIPNWIMVFKRIFNWRLMNLSSGPNSSVYVLRNDNADQISRGFDQSGFEDGFSSPHLSRPSLDEVINVGCYPLPLGSKEVQPEALQPPRIATAYDDARVAASTGDIMGNEGTHMQDCALVGADDVDFRNRSPKNGNTEIILSGKSAKDTDRLSQLLEQCNLIQNAIDEKLHIYF